MITAAIKSSSKVWHPSALAPVFAVALRVHSREGLALIPQGHAGVFPAGRLSSGHEARERNAGVIGVKVDSV